MKRDHAFDANCQSTGAVVLDLLGLPPFSCPRAGLRSASMSEENVGAIRTDNGSLRVADVADKGSHIRYIRFPSVVNLSLPSHQTALQAPTAP